MKAANFFSLVMYQVKSTYLTSATFIFLAKKNDREGQG